VPAGLRPDWRRWASCLSYELAWAQPHDKTPFLTGRTTSNATCFYAKKISRRRCLQHHLRLIVFYFPVDTSWTIRVRVLFIQPGEGRAQKLPSQQLSRSARDESPAARHHINNATISTSDSESLESLESSEPTYETYVAN
jgi:hypothetical protein